MSSAVKRKVGRPDRDPRTRRVAAALLVGLFAFVALLLRLAIDFDGVLDTDTINFGLAALHFDVLTHQPQPPGYPGYVLYLKLIHLLAPGLGALEIAKWGSRIAGVATVPAAFWACRQALALAGSGVTFATTTGAVASGAAGAAASGAAASDAAASDAAAANRATLAPLAQPLVAALFATVTPILWYYGGDGQAHAAEGLLALVLFALTARARRALLAAKPTRSARVGALAVVAAFGLAGSVRPTLPALLVPLLVWLFWGRPLRDWLGAVVIGLASVAAWFLPLVQVVGGWDLYNRANQALVGNLFVDSYSVFGAHVTTTRALRNASYAGLSLVLAVVPALAWARARGPRRQGWRLAIMASAALAFLFFALVYTAEPGYFAGVAGLACLVPATWAPDRRSIGIRVRAGLAAALAIGFVLLGPASLPIPGQRGALAAPTLAHVAETGTAAASFRQLVCDATDGKPALLVTDDPVTTHSRVLPLVCPDVTIALWIHDLPLAPALDNWLIFGPATTTSVPTLVPLEPGAPVRRTIGRFERVIVAPDASEKLMKAVDALSGCMPVAGAPGMTPPVWPDSPIVYPGHCMPVIKLGSNTLVLSSRHQH